MVVYDFKNKLSALGVIKQVLGSNTYSVDCGKGPRHVSGDALSKSSLDSEELAGQPRLTAQEDNHLVQEDAHESDVTVSESDSSDDEDYAQDLVPAAAVPRRRRRVRQLELGPICPTRLRQTH